MEILEVKNLMVFFENALAINDFSMTVDEGEMVGVLGPNSSGKTTLMNTISGLLWDLRIKEMRRGGERISFYGSIFYKGEDITNLPPAHRVRKGIVLCRERHPIFKESPVIENLMMSGYMQDKEHIKNMIQYSFELFPNLKRLKNKRAGFLSGGEQQMLAVSMALVARPTLLLLDEPLLGLSPVMQRLVISAVLTFKQDLNITVIITEQFARPVLPIISRGYIIENGILTLSGTGKELMDNPEVKAAYFGA